MATFPGSSKAFARSRYGAALADSTKAMQARCRSIVATALRDRAPLVALLLVAGPPVRCRAHRRPQGLLDAALRGFLALAVGLRGCFLIARAVGAWLCGCFLIARAVCGGLGASDSRECKDGDESEGANQGRCEHERISRAPRRRAQALQGSSSSSPPGEAIRATRDPTRAGVPPPPAASPPQGLCARNRRIT